MKPPVAVWLMFSADASALAKAREVLRPLFPEVPLGAGEDTNFTELNRTRPDPKSIDVVSYGMNPQVHAFDYASMIETLTIEGDTIENARQIVGKLPILMSPVTLKVQLVNQAPLAAELAASHNR